LSPAEHAVFRALFVVQGIASRYEIAGTVGHEPYEIQMYVKRIRIKFTQAARRVGVKLPAEAIIRSFKHRGYKLVIRIRLAA